MFYMDPHVNHSLEVIESAKQKQKWIQRSKSVISV